MIFIDVLLIVFAFGVGYLIGDHKGHGVGRKAGYEAGQVDGRKQLAVQHASDLAGVRQAHTAQLVQKDKTHESEVARLNEAHDRAINEVRSQIRGRARRQ